MLHVIHIIGSINRKHGGPGEVVCNLALSQYKLDARITIITKNSKNNILNEIEHNINIIELDNNSKFLNRNDRAVIFNFLDRYKDEKLIFHLHGIWELMLYFSSRLIINNNYKYIVMPHGMLDPWSLKQKRIKKILAIKFYVKNYFNNSESVHVLTNKEERDTISVFPNVNTQIIPNGIDLNRIYDKDKLSDKIKQYKNQAYILFLSRIHFKKGLDYLISALKNIQIDYPELKLIVAGNDDGHLEEIKKLIEQLNITKSIDIIGPVYNSDKLFLMEHAKIFCLPSRQEGFSVAILEALSVGTPVVISDKCNFSDVVLEEVGAEFNLLLNDNKKTIDNLTQTLLSFLKIEKNTRSTLSEKTIKLISDKYTWNKIAALTINLYHKTLIKNEE